MRLFLLPALVLPLPLVSAQGPALEDFDAPGSSWAATLFPQALLGFAQLATDPRAEEALSPAASRRLGGQHPQHWSAFA